MSASASPCIACWRPKVAREPTCFELFPFGPIVYLKVEMKLSWNWKKESVVMQIAG
jgi:hypothetical protein